MLYVLFLNHRLKTLARRNYIATASNLQNSQVEVCFFALLNSPVDLAKVHYQRGTGIYNVRYKHPSTVISDKGYLCLYVVITSVYFS